MMQFTTRHDASGSAREIGCGTLRASAPGQFSGVQVHMLIRSTPHACVVILPSGLTLELSYDQHVSRYAHPGEHTEFERAPITHGVWIFREEVVAEVKVGLA